MSFTTAALLVAWLAIVLLALGFAGLMRQLGELHRSVATGAASAATTAPTLRGLAIPRSGDLGRIRPEGGGLILFVSPGCSSCAIALEEVRPGSLDGQLVLASSGPCPDPTPPGAVCVSDTRPLMERLGVPGTPYLIDVDLDGVITASLLPQGADQVRDFVAARRSTSTGGSR